MIRVLLVDDQELVRSGFRIILETEPGIEVVGEASNGAEAVALAVETAPDVICMDIEMPLMNGIEASRRILEAAAGSGSRSAGAAAGSSPAPISILVLTTFGHEHYLFDALSAGVSGFLLKTARAEQLIDAVRTLASGGALLGPDVTRAVIERVAHDRRAGASAQASGVAEGGDPTPIATAPNPATPDPTAQAPTAQAPAPRPSTDAADPLDSAGLTEREREVLLLLADGLSNAEIASRLFLGEATVKTHVSNLLQKVGARDRIQAVVWAHTRGVVG